MSPWKPLANLWDVLSLQAKAVEETVEVMLLRLEEFCSLTDLVSIGLDLGPGQTLGSPGISWGSLFHGDLATWVGDRAAAGSERKATRTLSYAQAPTTKAPRGCRLDSTLPPSWFLFHGGARSGPPGGTLGHRCRELFGGDAEPIFNFPQLGAARPANMETARKWLQACKAQEEPPARLWAAVGGAGQQVPSRISGALLFCLPPCFVGSNPFGWAGKTMKDEALGQEDKVSTLNALEISSRFCVPSMVAC